MLESRYGEILKTDNGEFKSLINEVLSDTLAHRKLLDGKIGEKISGNIH
jgi:hypothetical protein